MLSLKTFYSEQDLKKSKEIHRTLSVSKTYLDCGDLGIVSGVPVNHKGKTNCHEKLSRVIKESEYQRISYIV